MGHSWVWVKHITMSRISKQPSQLWCLFAFRIATFNYGLHILSLQMDSGPDDPGSCPLEVSFASSSGLRLSSLIRVSLFDILALATQRRSWRAWILHLFLAVLQAAHYFFSWYFGLVRIGKSRDRTHRKRHGSLFFWDMGNGYGYVTGYWFGADSRLHGAYR